MDPRARLIISQLAETLREFARKCDKLIGDDSPLTPAELAEFDHSSIERKCSKCGAIGYNARSCGKNHNISQAR